MRQAIRNYTNAIKKIGGTVVYETGGCATMKVTKNKQEIWAGVTVAAGYEYTVTIIEKEEMRQDVVAVAEAMMNDIATTGHVAILRYREIRNQGRV